MEVTKELVLESMNTYCTERKYGSEALTDSFKEKFSNFFVKRYEGKDVDEDTVKSDLHFNLDTAFSASVDLKTLVASQFTTKETEYKNQIAELTKKLGLQTPPPSTPPKFELPKEIQEQLDELKAFKVSESKKDKFKNIMKIAKQGIRQDQHKAFETFAEDFEVALDKEDNEQAEKLASRFKAIMKDGIGEDITPLAPRQNEKVEKEMLESVQKIEL